MIQRHRMLQIKTRAPSKPAAALPTRGVLFLSYSHVDQPAVLPFVQHLQPLVEREELALFFDARDLKAGDLWSDKIDAALAQCELFVLLVSPDCLASKFCVERELLMALDRQRRGLCRIVPVVLRDCDWQRKLLPDGSGRELGAFQVLPAGGVAIAASSGAALDSAWLGVVHGLAAVLADPAAAQSPPRRAVDVPPLLPYLCDQVMTESEVRQLLRTWSARPGPLVVMLRARAQDCPDHFINRIDERHLRKLLPRLTPGLQLQRHGGLQWPRPPSRPPAAADLETWFMEQITERVMGDPYPTEAELLDRMREEGTNRLFIGSVPTAPPEFVRVSLRALSTCLARLNAKLDKVRLAAALWSEDQALAPLELGEDWDCSDACIGRPAPLGNFDREAMRDWAMLDEVQKFADIDQTRLDEALGDPGRTLSMREFAALALPLLQRHARQT